MRTWTKQLHLHNAYQLLDISKTLLIGGKKIEKKTLQIPQYSSKTQKRNQSFYLT